MMQSKFIDRNLGLIDFFLSQNIHSCQNKTMEVQNTQFLIHIKNFSMEKYKCFIGF